MATRGPQNGLQGLGRCATKGFWAVPSTFAKKFYDLGTPSIRKVEATEEKQGKNRREQTKKDYNVENIGH